jgi:hypothetical protein
MGTAKASNSGAIDSGEAAGAAPARAWREWLRVGVDVAVIVVSMVLAPLRSVGAARRPLAEASFQIANNRPIAERSTRAGSGE